MQQTKRTTHKKVGQSYLELLQKSNEDQQSQDNQFTADQKSLQLQSDILATKKLLNEKVSERDKFLQSKDLDFEKLVKLDIFIESYTNGLKRLEDYQIVLFPKK